MIDRVDERNERSIDTMCRWSGGRPTINHCGVGLQLDFMRFEFMMRREPVSITKMRKEELINKKTRQESPVICKCSSVCRSYRNSGLNGGSVYLI